MIIANINTKLMAEKSKLALVEEVNSQGYLSVKYIKNFIINFCYVEKNVLIELVDYIVSKWFMQMMINRISCLFGQVLRH